MVSGLQQGILIQFDTLKTKISLPRDFFPVQLSPKRNIRLSYKKKSDTKDSMRFKLIIKKIEGSLNDKEEKEFQRWYWESPQHRQYFERVKSGLNRELDVVDVKKGWRDLQVKLVNKKHQKLKRVYWEVGVAASILLLIATTFSLTNSASEPNPYDEIVQQEIAPGSPKAILTLENGETLVLNEKTEIIEPYVVSHGNSITYTKETDAAVTERQYNTLSVPRGGEFSLTLSDRTQVWLNSETKIKYPTRFLPDEPRQVELVFGEAYFDVTHSSENGGSSFEVMTGDQKITVLGTKFNIQAYRDEKIYTTLVSGKVTVNTEQKLVELTPGLQSIVSRDLSSDQIHIRKVDVDQVVAWVNGYFKFDRMPLDKMMTILGRWYDLDVVYLSPEKKNLLFSGELKRTSNINGLLVNLQKTGDIEFEIQRKQLKIK